jgi:putative zinc finger/helix-turn-helix YgiT family protein
MNRPYPWKCRTCREKAVKPVTVDYATEMEHDGRLYNVAVKDLAVLRCEACGAQTLPDESYEKLLDELRRQAELLMPSEITKGRERFGLSQKQFAHLLGVAPETVSRWEKGRQIQQRVMNDFMLAFFNVRELRDYLSRLRDGGEGGTEPKPTAVSNTTLQTWGGGLATLRPGAPSLYLPSAPRSAATLASPGCLK